MMTQLLRVFFSYVMLFKCDKTSQKFTMVKNVCSRTDIIINILANVHS